MLFNSNNQKDKMPLVAADVGCWKLNCVVLDPGYTAGEQRTLDRAMDRAFNEFAQVPQSRRRQKAPTTRAFSWLKAPTSAFTF